MGLLLSVFLREHFSNFETVLFEVLVQVLDVTQVCSCKKQLTEYLQKSRAAYCHLANFRKINTKKQCGFKCALCELFPQNALVFGRFQQCDIQASGCLTCSASAVGQTLDETQRCCKYFVCCAHLNQHYLLFSPKFDKLHRAIVLFCGIA